ncbi:MAG TPA: trypsin-like peptidase domain-containing protein [Rhodopila sp.]|nr:trypsin-like peptidase domain-containing protein [Rhodopila sp.]
MSSTPAVPAIRAWPRVTGQRMRRLAAVLLVAVWTTAGMPAHADTALQNTPELIRNVLEAVVNITVRKDMKRVSPAAEMAAATVSSSKPDHTAPPDIKTFIGSGFVVDPDGLVVTNYHVVEDAFEIKVMLPDGTVLTGTMESASRLADLALVRIHPDHKLVPVHWGDSNKVAIGEQVFAAGNPFGIGLSVSAGIVSAVNRDIQSTPYDDFIQTDATINHGNSGGPLFDMEGKVIGVNSAIISPTTGSAGLGFALPSNSARFVIERLEKYGWIRPAWIGVKLQQVTEDMAQAMGMSQPQGAIVAWVLPDSPAHKAGLEVGDIVLQYNNQTPQDERALLRDIVATPVGTTVPLVLRRDGVQHTVSITPEVFPRDQWAKQDAPLATERPKIVIPPDLGLNLAPVPKAEKMSLGMTDGLTAVLVAGVAPDSDAARRGMTDGDLILRVQNKSVATPAQVQAGIDAARAAKRNYVLMLVLPKVRPTPGPKWMALQVGVDG